MRVINSANKSRSTAVALPAGTAVCSTAIMVRDPRILSSSLSNPGPDSKMDDLSEFEHTSSAKFGLECAGLNRKGFISIKRTSIPHSAKA